MDDRETREFLEDYFEASERMRRAEERFAARVREKQAALAPAIEEAMRIAIDASIHGVSYVDRDGNRIAPEDVRPAE